jgi:hypothetical protein
MQRIVSLRTIQGRAHVQPDWVLILVWDSVFAGELE